MYNIIIENRLSNPYQGYVEKHHIKPKSLGGDNSKSNLVSLTAREHFICHFLLTKIYKKGSNEWYKMTRAFMMMKMSSLNQNRYFNSHLYETKREDFSLVMSTNQKGKGNSQYGTMWIYNLELDEVLKIKKEDFPKYKDLGWLRGRKNKSEVKKTLIKKEDKQKASQAKKEEKKLLYSEYYSIYKEVGFEKFVEITKYDKSKQNLVQMFSKWVQEFVPQNGKRRC